MKREYDASHGGGGTSTNCRNLSVSFQKRAPFFTCPIATKEREAFGGIEPIHAVDDFSIHRNAVQQWIDDAHRIVVCCKKE